MKKGLGLAVCLLLTLLCVTALADAAINDTNFPDEKFRAYVLENCDTDGDGTLSDSEIAGVTFIDCAARSISSLKGIEYFSALNLLWCHSNQLTGLDVSENTALVALACNLNPLKSLDVSRNTKLTWLCCEYNQLTGLDVGKNTALKELYCSNNELTSLDISRNAELKILCCNGNKITKLDLSGTPILKKLVQETTPGKNGDMGYGWWQDDEYGYVKIGLFVEESAKVITGESTTPVTSVKLNKKKAFLSITLAKPNPTLQLEATVSPDDATDTDVTWKSSNRKVATVSSSGQVTAKGYGTCKITATAKDGSQKKATCTITVTVDEVQDKTLKYSLNHDKKTAMVLGPRKTSLQTAAVPAAVKANGKTYKVTAIADEAFRGMKKLTAFSTGKSLTTIGKSAFEGCTKLKKITVQSAKISRIGKGAFQNTCKKVTLSLSKDLKKTYIRKLVKMLTAGGIGKITQVVE